MTSFLDPTLTAPLVDKPSTSKDHPAVLSVATESPPVPPPPLSVEERLRSLTPRTPVTWVLVAANVVLFAAMALTHGRLFHFSPHVLLTWGGGLAPRVFDHQWWRAGSHMFLHANLAHLAANLLFLLLIAPLVERLLGPSRFALVYLFAGLGGGLLVMGTYPQQVVVGASAAVYGVYGALLGCSLRGPRSVPWRLVAQRGGLLLLYIAVSLLGEWLDFARQPVAHLGGFVFGLVGGLLCGHQLQQRSVHWRLARLAVIASVCVVLISLTAWGVHRCAAKALAYYGRYATAKDRERELLGQFDDALRQWERGKITSAQWKQVLEKKLLPAWQDTRSSCGLKLTGELAEFEKRSFTMQDFWSALRSLRGKRKARDKKPLTITEYGNRYCLLCKVRLDTWRALANDLPGNRILMVRALLDDRELNALFAALDDEVNEDNPLYRWFELKRTGQRPVEKEAEERPVQAIQRQENQPPPKDKKGGKPTAIKGKGTTTIIGTVTYDGDMAELNKDVKKLNARLLADLNKATPEKNMCLAGTEREKTTYQWRVNPKNKGVKNVFVWIRPVNADGYFDVSDLVKKGEGFPKVVKLDQPHCAYIPHAFLLFQRYVDPSDPDKELTKHPKTGQIFVVVNSAIRPHNTKWEGPGAIQGGNVSIAPGETKTIDDFKASYRGPVMFSCSIHPWMRSYAWSFDHPFAAVTDENGKYEIKNVPAGVKVRIVAWHEEAKFLTGDAMGEEFDIPSSGGRKDFKFHK